MSNDIPNQPQDQQYASAPNGQREYSQQGPYVPPQGGPTYPPNGYGPTPNEAYRTQQASQIPLCPKTYLLESILVTIFCCLPFGIPAIVYASKVDMYFYSGLYEKSLECSQKASKWTLAALITGVLGALLYGLFIMFVVMLGNS